MEKRVSYNLAKVLSKLGFQYYYFDQEYYNIESKKLEPRRMQQNDYFYPAPTIENANKFLMKIYNIQIKDYET